MNEQHTPAGTAGYKANLASPGDNSPVLGRGSDRDRFVGTGAGHEFRTHGSDYRSGAPRERGAPIRRVEHDFDWNSRRAPERHETNPCRFWRWDWPED
jgi:hypothetical protein